MAETREREETNDIENDEHDLDERPRSRERSSRGRPAPRGGGSYGGRRFRGRPRVCYFCVNKVTTIDYKDVDTLRRFVTDRGRIRPRRQTGTCAKHQRRLATSVKRARHLALLPFATGLSQD